MSLFSPVGPCVDSEMETTIPVDKPCAVDVILQGKALLKLALFKP
jgi:hypothetical protein